MELWLDYPFDILKLFLQYFYKFYIFVTGDSIMKDQRLGIVIGCSIGLSSIIICIVVVVVRHR